MNDCVWSFLCGICEDSVCQGCRKYIDVHATAGSFIVQNYQQDVDNALNPVVDKWKGIYAKYEPNKFTFA